MPRDRAAASAGVRLTQLHTHAAHAAHVTVLALDFDRVGQKVKDDALFLGVVDLFRPGRALGAGAAVDAVDLLRTQTQRDPHRVQGGVATAHHQHLLADTDSRVEMQQPGYI